MSFKRAMYGWLSTQAGIVAVAGDRIWPDVIPDQVFDTASKRPCLVFSRQAADRTRTFCGTIPLVASSIAIDCYARTYDGAEQLAAAVRSALTDFRGDMDDVSVTDVRMDSDFDLVDIEPGLFRVSLSFTVWHSETL